MEKKHCVKPATIEDILDAYGITQYEYEAMLDLMRKGKAPKIKFKTDANGKKLVLKNGKVIGAQG